jgi:carbamoyl-phosphate synthase large subunit
MAIGYTLDEVPNDITRETPASFEPTLDYVVVKVPRFAFEKFPAADPTLTTTMKSVGEAMAIGRNFTEALQKALRSLEKKGASFHWDGELTAVAAERALEEAKVPTDGRIVHVQQALRGGISVERVHDATGIDPWFLDQIALVNDVAELLAEADELTPDLLRLVKRHGFSDAQVASLRRMPEAVVRGVRHALGVRPVFKTVDTCAAEFAAATPYHYSAYDEETEVEPRERPAVIILGSGPNRIGQGVEFDYSCVHASFALRDKGFDTVMVNCNPETVSTDYDTSSRLYFEPLTLEDVLEVIHAETKVGPVAGVIVQLGGQTPLALAQALADEGVPIVGTSPEAIHLAEDRGAFGQVLARAGLVAPKHGTALSADDALAIAREIGYPVLVRPSYVLGGRGMVIVYDDDSLVTYVEMATEASPEHPVLVDRFLDDAIEIDVDALFDGEEMYLGGIMEHVEEAGIHSGDSSCTLPPATLGEAELVRVREATRKLAEGIGVRGLMNVQFALAQDILYVIEANPRASRTVPFVAKATGVPIASAASRVMLGASIAELREEGLLPRVGDGGSMPDHAPVSCKEAVLPFKRFRTKEGLAVDSLLGPEMRSTGEVMGIDVDFGSAFSKAQQGVGVSLPREGAIFVSVANRDKRAMLFPVKRLADLGFTILATTGTAAVLRRNGIDAKVVRKITERGGVHDPSEPSIVDLIRDGSVQMVVNTPSGQDARADGYAIRAATTSADKPIVTTIATLAAAVLGIEAQLTEDIRVKSLQDHARDLDLYGRGGEGAAAASSSPPAEQVADAATTDLPSGPSTVGATA